MIEPDLKKLITGFLMLAILASSGAFVFSTFSRTHSSAPIPEKNLATAGVAEGNVLTEPIPDPIPQNAPVQEIGGIPGPTDPSNMTDVMASVLAQQLIAANPSGPQLLGNAQDLTVPSEAILQGLLQGSSLQLPSDDFVKDVPDEELRIVAGASQTDIDAYLSGVTKVFQETTLGSQFKNLTAQSASMNSIAMTPIIYDQAIQRMRLVPTPTILVPLQKSILINLENQKKIFDIAANYTRDPLKAAIVLPQAKAIMAQDLQTFQDELQITTEQIKTSQIKDGHEYLSLLENLFGVPTAHAQLGVPIQNIGPTLDKPTLLYYGAETTNTAGHWAETVWQFLEKVLTEQLKNQIIHQLVQQVIAWVQGGGKPQFVQNWKGFLKDAANDALGAAIYQTIPQLCSSFQPIFEVSLYTSRLQNSIEYRARCTLDDVVANVQDFYNDFESGGWVAYSATLEPTNNVFGAALQVDDILLEESDRARSAADSEGAAAGGFLTAKVCTEYAVGPFPPGVEPPCLHWENTTPGGLVGNITSKAIAGSPVEHIVNVQDLAELVSALVDTFLNQMITQGFQLVTPSSQTYTSGTPLSTACSGLTGTAYTNCINNINNVPPPPPYGGSTSTVPTSDTQAPTVPANLNGFWQPFLAQVHLTWTASTDNVGVTGYRIYRSVNGGPATVLLTTASVLYNDDAVNSGSSYTYTVRAYDAAGNESADSNQATVAIP